MKIKIAIAAVLMLGVLSIVTDKSVRPIFNDGMFKFPITRCSIDSWDDVRCNTDGVPIQLRNPDGSHNHDRPWELYRLPHSNGAEVDLSPLCGQDPVCHLKVDIESDPDLYRKLKKFSDSIPNIPTTHERKLATMPNSVDKW